MLFRSFIKFIKQFYNSTGIEDSIKFLYRILLNDSLEVYYPKNDMLRVSDGRWNFDRFIYVNSPLAYSSFVSAWDGHRILESDSATTAIVQSVEEVAGATGFYKVNLMNINGQFTASGLIEGATGSAIYDYPPTGIGNQIGTTFAHHDPGATGVTPINGLVYWKGDGSYIGDYGQLSSRKKIQDSYYYQDFSYEVQLGATGPVPSTVELGYFRTALEKLIHPAGLRYFIRLNVYGEEIGRAHV